MPPPPPPPPPGPPGPPGPPPSGPPKATKGSEKGRTALLTDICKGTRLKPASHLMVDKSKPILGSEGSSTTKFGTVSSRGGHRKAGGPVASNSTVGPAGGRGGRNVGPPALAGLFAGGVPRPKAMASHDSTVQNGYRSTPAHRQMKPGVANSTMVPPPPPPSAACKPALISSNQESLTGHGANGRISGLGIPSGFPPTPPSHMPRPPPQKLTGNRAPPPPPPARVLDNRALPPPPPQMAPSNGRVPPPRYAPPPVPRPPGIAPPPPPARNNPPPPPPPVRDQPAPSRPPANAKPQVPPVPPPVKKNSLESRFTFRNELPQAPGTFRKSPKTYPSAVPKSTRSSGSGNRPCPPPPPV